MIFILCIFSAMVDSMGGPQRVNNVLSTLNLPVISNKNLKKMERRAGKMIEEYAEESMKRASFSAYDQEMRFAFYCTIFIIHF